MSTRQQTLDVLKLIAKGHPEPVTIYDDGDHLSAMRDEGLVDEYDMWPDGSRRWTLTKAGAAALKEGGG